MTISPWIIADNGVRNPYRLKDGLRVFVNSSFHGDFSRENEEAIAHLLHSEGVINLVTNSDNTISRKWRLNFMRLGFITEDTHVVTANGRRLLQSSSLPSEEECFLRALLAHQIPSSVHNFAKGKIEPFSPLRMILEVINGLKKSNLEPEITQNELASIVILCHDMNQIDDIVENIINYRKEREQSAHRGKFDVSFREKAASIHGKISSNSLISYADVNFRYLKATGLFSENGKKLRIAMHKQSIYLDILSKPYKPIPKKEYEEKLAAGSMLPTDNEHESIVVIKKLQKLLIDNGESPEPLSNLSSTSIQDLSHLRIELENDWIHVLENRYAEKQVDQWEDILKYLTALQNPRKHTHIIPNGEAPAYLEWSLWRSFLALGHLKNLPWESRRFTIDRKFLPVRHAPGGGPDIIFEYDNFVIVMEVTLTSSSRQEAAEGEPVRRHVAQYVDAYNENNKRVYGVFIANNIDTNTAETFRIGVWYRKDDSEMALQIVPMTLVDFTNLFKAIFINNKKEDGVYIIQNILDVTLSFGNERAPMWKKRISEIINRDIKSLE